MQNKGAAGSAKDGQLHTGTGGTATAALDPLPLEKANEAANASQKLAEVAGACLSPAMLHDT